MFESESLGCVLGVPIMLKVKVSSSMVFISKQDIGPFLQIGSHRLSITKVDSTDSQVVEVTSLASYHEGCVHLFD